MTEKEINGEHQRFCDEDLCISNGVSNEDDDSIEDCLVLQYARVAYDYNAKTDVELDLTCGDTVAIQSKINDDWWWGEVNGRLGYVPVNYITSDLIDDIRGSDWQNEHYFDIYGQLQVQYEMLSDRPRTLAYLDAIQKNSAYIAGTRVMDVGCGTGILSLFLARDGKAGKVFAVEASPVNKIAENVIKANGYGDEIEVIDKMVEDVRLEDKVDLIVSEWMGTLLLSEFMIESVIKARDMFLKANGKIWPSQASLYIVPCSAAKIYQSTVGFWNDVYGFNFSSVQNISRDEQTVKPHHDHVLKKEDILAKPVPILDLDMKTIAIQEIEHISSNFEFSVFKSGVLNGFSTWFTLNFEHLSGTNAQDVFLNTGPNGQLTHWKHPLLFMDEMTHVVIGDTISGTIELIRNIEMRRHLAVRIRCKISRENDVISSFDKTFKCWE